MLPKAIKHFVQDHVTNEEVRRKILAAIAEHDKLLTLVKKRKLRWFGHVSRSSGLAKKILKDTAKGKGRRDRQTKRREDNIKDIKEWTGMDFSTSTRAAKNRARWKVILQFLCGAPTTFNGYSYGIKQNRNSISDRVGRVENEMFYLSSCCSIHVSTF